MGAKVTGYALNPPTKPSLFKVVAINELINSVIGDITELHSLEKAMRQADPEIVIHMAAQPLVKESYKDPVKTYTTNVMGTVNLFESVKKCNSVKVVINVTTDKCYENKEWVWGYRENDPIGGYDPYSNSKACSELVTASYRSSFFNPDNYKTHGVAIASVRAGNVIGGGDWAQDRLIPDCIQSIVNNEPILIRNPNAIRPWQHVLEPLSGYLLLAENLFHYGTKFSGAWNFGPNDREIRSVEWVVKKVIEEWGGETSYQVDNRNHLHEAGCLMLDCSKAYSLLKWRPKLDTHQSIDWTVKWYKNFVNRSNMQDYTLKQLIDYLAL